MGKIVITVKSLITPEAYEKLEDALRDFLENFGVSAEIDDVETGNTTVSREGRAKLLRAGFTGKEIEKIHVALNSFEVEGVNWQDQH
jgi:hypothetical protein